MYTYSEKNGLTAPKPKYRYCVFFWKELQNGADINGQHPLIFNTYPELLQYLDGNDFQIARSELEGITIERLPVLFDWEI